jgi:hypothetical protein
MNKKIPLVLTCKELSVPRNYVIIERLKDNKVIAVHRPFAKTIQKIDLDRD